MSPGPEVGQNYIICGRRHLFQEKQCDDVAQNTSTYLLLYTFYTTRLEGADVYQKLESLKGSASKN